MLLACSSSRKTCLYYARVCMCVYACVCYVSRMDGWMGGWMGWHGFVCFGVCESVCMDRATFIATLALRTRGDWSWSWMELSAAARCFQKAISASGVGCCPCRHILLKGGGGGCFWVDRSAMVVVDCVCWDRRAEPTSIVLHSLRKEGACQSMSDLLEERLRVLLEHVADLLRPRYHRALQQRQPALFAL